MESLCHLCAEFAKDLTASFAREDEEIPLTSERWVQEPFTSQPQLAFRHYGTFEDLVNSAKTCSLCHVLADEFTREGGGPDGEECLALFPETESWSNTPSKSEHKYAVILATFKRDRGHYGYKWAWEPHEFHIREHRPYDFGAFADGASKQGGKRWRALPQDTGSKDAFESARFWMDDCRNNHARCVRPESTLPTRVIDLGVTADDVPSLYVAKGEKQPYVALTHCWGGNIPNKTTIDLLDRYRKQIPMDTLPQNFLDAIRVTRELGLRYLWIDALCIIQDSAEDWLAEAGRMASIYSQAFVTISALDADKSTIGFLGSRDTKQAKISPGISVSQETPRINELLQLSALDSRGWCMQERFLSPALLHYSKGPMVWECREGVASETDGPMDNIYGSRRRGVSDRSFKFFDLRRDFWVQKQSGYSAWYDLIEEYSRRNLTKGSDKLPALAGVAQQFVSNGVSGRYVAGLFEDDLLKGLFWFARSKRHYGSMGYAMHGRHALQRPDESRVPSWSWAAVDGPVEFRFKNPDVQVEDFVDKNVFQILSVDIRTGYDDLTAMKVEGSLRIRGPLAKMHYFGTDAHIGTLTFPRTNYEDTIGIANITAVMDTEGEVSRDCWVLVTAGGAPNHEFPPGVLLLEKVGEGIFSRLGCGDTPFWLQEEEFSKFTIEEFSLV